MNDERTHASFFSGVGGLDMGLERAGWRTVSFSEIDPYASAVLAERWPGVPNLGDILELVDQVEGGRSRGRTDGGDGDLAQARWRSSDDVPHATLWTGGFPCQDLSVAGKRRGMGAGTRSGLAYAFLDLVGRHRPRFVLLENVPGLLSSHGGRDMAALIGALVELGYGVGYRVLDARHFGVPQRRRRVFILGVTPGGRAGAERAAEVLSVGSRCRRHPPTGIEAGERAADGAPDGFDGVGPLSTSESKNQQESYQGHLRVIGSSSDPGRVRAPDGLAGGPHDRDGLANAISASSGHHGHSSPRGDGGDNLVAAFTKSHNVSATDGEHWATDREARAMNGFDGDRTTLVTGTVAADPLLPLGLDSHRYRCCGNGVVADVSFWIGQRLAALLATPSKASKGA